MSNTYTHPVTKQIREIATLRDFQLHFAPNLWQFIEEKALEPDTYAMVLFENLELRSPHFGERRYEAFREDQMDFLQTEECRIGSGRDSLFPTRIWLKEVL